MTKSLRDLFGDRSDGDPGGDRSVQEGRDDVDRDDTDDVDPKHVAELESELSSMADRIDLQADRIDDLESELSSTQSRLDLVSKSLAGSTQSPNEQARKTESDDVSEFKKMLAGK